MHVGLLEAAQHGTIFLDEITEMSPGLQGKLLRFMQNGEVRRLGGHEARHVGVRVVAAANRDIDEEARAGRFRSDLLYRFVVRLQVPPLRAHREDIPQLIESFLQKWGYPTVRISDEAMELFMSYDWPGNVRELENVLRQTLLLSPFAVILPENLPGKFRPVPHSSGRTAPDPPARNTAWNQSQSLQALENPPTCEPRCFVAGKTPSGWGLCVAEDPSLDVFHRSSVFARLASEHF